VRLQDTLRAVLREPPPPPPESEVARALARAIPRASAQAVILTGVRRCGKSTLLSQLLRRGGPSAFVNFEDTRLFGLGPEDFSSFLSVLDEARPGPAAVGLDEVQEVPEWQRLVRALLDRRKTVLVTGSNASLLGKEVGVRLTGRHLSFEVHPFSYAEYLTWSRRPAGEASLRTWLDDGGFPPYLRERRDEILRELLRDIIQRDIASRHGLREIRHVLNLALFLLANTGQPFSLRRLARTLSVPTVSQASRYLEYLQDAYLLLALPKFSPSFRQRVISSAKYYAVDNGLRRANSPQTTPDLGHRIENAVYLELRRRGARPAWAGESDLWECDFVTDEAAIQVCAELTRTSAVRELAGITRAAALPGTRKRRALILTLRQSDHMTVDGRPVEVTPAWKWLADGR
jgi:hypothetical protein